MASKAFAMNITSTLRCKGLLNPPGITHISRTLVEVLLAKDAREHHCYFRSFGLHNHLSHHVFAAYDLGAPHGLLQKIYDEESKMQRPIFSEEKDREIVITKENWTRYLGNQHAYGAYFHFFCAIIHELGVLKTLEQYVFAPEANGNDTNMLFRLVSGALHPFINIGYGLEFGSDIVVAAGLAQATIHDVISTAFYDLKEPTGESNKETEGIRAPSRGLSLLEILREFYDSDILKPVMPYDPDALFSKRVKSALADGRAEEIKRLCSQFVIDTSLGDKEFDAKVEEIIWAVTLLLFATGRSGRKPRLDFFLMHLVTSSLFFPSYFRVLENPAHKATLLRVYLPGIILFSLSRGRPRIDIELLMSYTALPRPPVLSKFAPQKGVIGNSSEDSDYNPWPAMIETVLYAHDSHVVKTMRALVYGARKYGDAPPGAAIGIYSTKDGKETHKGIAKLDGTIFVRAAGMLVDYMGWTGHGQAPRDDWDRSAHGWDDAWKTGE